MELCTKTASELIGMLRAGEIDPIDIVDSTFKRINEKEPDVKAFIAVLEESARKRAEELKDADRSLPLYGIPVAVKDNMCMRGAQTTCGSKILTPYEPPYDATVVEKLKAAGAVIVGKTNMDEFAMGSSCEWSAHHPTRNPWDLERAPGGSSGGSAAAVAACECAMSLGSDTGGSIRQPASLCGVVGMKPTYGAVSRYGLVAFASSLDQIGPFARDVRDCAMLLDVICGHDPKDSTSIDREPPDHVAALDAGAAGMTIGMIKDLFGDGVEPGVRERVSAAAEVFEKMGAKIKEIEMPIVKYALPAYYLIAPAEASSNLARYDGVQYGMRENADDIVSMFRKTRRAGFGAEVKRRIMLGTYALSAGYYDAYYLRALKVRTLIVKEFEKAFAECDILMSPTSPATAFKLNEKIDDPLAMYMMDICTIPVNLAGLPGMSIPCGLSDGLPVGLQLIGPTLGEQALLRAARAFEIGSGICGMIPGEKTD
ncbi:MAG TPA: Asp-tRNA(Asn)/Glu-tRNA(Gln) amidotransferase subunit GatA [bacterium]|nr:Asp-tRNA(Asn)/Glu-tRNA(Gln) amidotransferase subunit GatA [bacterium]